MLYEAGNTYDSYRRLLSTPVMYISSFGKMNSLSNLFFAALREGYF